MEAGGIDAVITETQIRNELNKLRASHGGGCLAATMDNTMVS